MLGVFGKLYGGVIGVRNSFFDRGVFRVHDLGCRTISVGNLTVGGTGKTPLVIKTARELIDRGETVCVLTRGYGRNSSGRVLVSDGTSVLSNATLAGDEAIEIAESQDGKIIVIADANRVAAAKWARERFEITRFILDDGFQHRRAERDVDIVCIDATAPGGPATSTLAAGRMLPAGRLRESIDGLRRATSIVITRCDLSDHVDDLVAEIESIAPAIPIFRSQTVIRSLIDENETDIPPERAGRALAFCGLGNPDAFFRSIDRIGVTIVGKKTFPDHHAYLRHDVEELVVAARIAGADTLLTTTKDAVKLAGMPIEMPILTAIAEISLDDEAGFFSKLG